MKKNVGFLIIALMIFFYACQPLASFQIDTISPAKINFPGSFNKIMFINLDNDFNDDNEIDTLLFSIITNEMKLGFYDGFQQTPTIDSANFITFNQLLDYQDVYKNDTINPINWTFFDKLEDQFGTDIVIVLDSLNFILDSGVQSDYFEYYKYLELTIIAYWKVIDVYERRILDSYIYGDTLFWDRADSDLNRLEKTFPSVIQCVKEASYFAALDYSKRIFPVWKTETRFYYIDGNKQFKTAAILVNDGKWEEATEIWKQYVKNIDKELASRACFNMAVASEMLGNIDNAIQWAQISFEIKEKKRTRYYILKLKNRKSEVDRLKRQL